jgi:hypothetical protein
MNQMQSIKDFLDEANQVFGFYFDVSMACQQALSFIADLQKQNRGVTDDSPFTYGDGPPTASPEEELKKSLHDTTLRGVKGRLSVDGYDSRKAAETAIVFTYHIWEEKYRGKIAGRDGKPIEYSDIMGDLRLIRNSIIHNKGIAKPDVLKCKVFSRFKPGDQIALSVSDIFAIVRAIRGEFRL